MCFDSAQAGLISNTHPTILTQGKKIESRKIPVPPHRLAPLKKEWLKLYAPLVEHMKLQVRMNIKSKTVEIRTCPDTQDTGAIQKGADFLRAFMLGFEVDVR